MSGLPAHLTSFVGRESILTTAETVRNKTRLITLTGAGGAGKTRLAIELASRWEHEFADGAWFVDLSHHDRPGGVADAVAATLGVPTESGRSAVAQMAEWARSRKALIVLDNCEHVIDEAAEVAANFAAARQIFLLATSREPLNIPGEAVIKVPSLEQAEAVQLFMDRASAAAGLTDEPDSAAAVAQLCRRLDGIPLALELAASQLRSTTPQALLQGIDRRFEALSTAVRGVPARHRTLEAVVESTWGLLDPKEQAVANRLSVLGGTFTPATAREVGGAEATARLPRLIDASVVDAIPGQAELRYRMAETIRDYGRAQLERSGELVEVLLRAAHEADDRQAYRSALALISRALDSVPTGDARELEILDLLAKCSERTAEYSVCLDALRRTRDLLGPESDADAKAFVSMRIGALTTLASGDLAAARTSIEEAIGLYTAVGSPKVLQARNELAWVVGLGGNLGGQVESARPVVAEAESVGDELVLLHALGCLAVGLIFQGLFREGSQHAQRGLALARKREDAYQVGWFSATLATETALEGDPRGALTQLEQVHEMVQEHLDPVYIESLMWSHHMCGNHRAVLAAFDANRESINRFGLRGGWALDLAAVASAELGDLAAAHRYLDRADSLYPHGPMYYQSVAHWWHQGQVAWVEGDLGGAAQHVRRAATAFRKMRAWPLAALALHDLLAINRAAGASAAGAKTEAELKDMLGKYESESLVVLAASDHAAAGSMFGALGMRGHEARALESAGLLEEAANVYEACGQTWRRDRALSLLATRGGAPSPGARLLARTAAFTGQASLELEELAAAGLPLRFSRGELVHERWQPAVTVEVVREGSLRLRAGEQVLGTAGPGEMIGERALLDGEKWVGDVEALTDGALLRVEPAAVLRFAEFRPAIAERLSTLLRQRLRQEAQLTGELEPADLPARLIGSIHRLSQAEGRRPPAFEILPVYLDAAGLHLLRPTGKPSWKVDTSNATPGEQVGQELRSMGLDAEIVHSTSWRYEDGRLVLTYLAVLGDGTTGGMESLPVGRADLARGSAHDAPRSIDVSQVVEHGLRHLSWLSKDDPVIKETLSGPWLKVVAGYQPEPFRAL